MNTSTTTFIDDVDIGYSHIRNQGVPTVETNQIWSNLYSSLLVKTNSSHILDIIKTIIINGNHSSALSKIFEIYDILVLKSIFYDIFSANESQIVEFASLLANMIYKESVEVILLALDIQILNGRFSFIQLSMLSSEKFTVWLKMLISFIHCDELQISDTSSRIIVNIMRMDYRNHSVLDVVLRELLSACDTYADDSVILFRYYMIFCDILSIQDDLFDASERLGIVKRLVDVSKSDDILGLMVIIEYYSKFASTSKGRVYLVRSGLLQWLLDTACQDESISAAAYDSSLAPQAIRVFTTILCALYTTPPIASDINWLTISEKLSKQFFQAAISLMDSRSVNHRIAGAQVISSFAASSVEALSSVVHNNVLVEAWTTLSHNSGNIELQAAVYDSLTHVLSNHAGGNDHISTTIKKLYDSIGTYHPRSGSSNDIVLAACKQPVHEMKHAALALFRQVASYPWGLLAIFSAENVMDYLEAVEYTREGRELKYWMLQAILDNPKVSHLSDAVVTKLQALERRGPNFVPANPEVDVMEA